MLAFDTVETKRHDDGMRRHRFTRVPPKAQLQLGRYGYEILEILYQFKALRTHHILMHLPHRHERGLVHSLRNLFDHGVIDKVSDVRRFNALYQSDVYTLSEKGREAISGRELPDRFVTPSLGFTLNKEWDHSMMIADLLSNLVAGIKRAGHRPISAEEYGRQAMIDEPFIFPRRTTYIDKKTREEQPYVVKPDGFIGVEYSTGGRANFAIEAEHNKPHDRHPDSPDLSTRKKFEQYADIDVPQVYKNLGIGNMRVLVVAPTPAQITNKFKAGEKALTSSRMFLGHWLPVVTDKDVPILPDIFDAPWLRIGRDEEYINGDAVRPSGRPVDDHHSRELRPQA